MDSTPRSPPRSPPSRSRSRPASSISSDRGETFEDAPDMTPRPSSHADRSRSRSLIRRESGGSNHSARADSPVPGVPATEKDTAPETHVVSEAPSEGAEADDEQPVVIDSSYQKSPLLTTHRVSVMSDMLDDVSLDEGADSADVDTPRLPPRSSGTPLQGFSGNMSPSKFPPPPTPPVGIEKRESLPPPAAPTRKLTSPFSWLSRNSSSKNKQPDSPPMQSKSPRRNTNASIATVGTIGSNPEMTLSKIDDQGSPNPNRSSQGSLRDRFKFLRMREEAGISLEEEASEATRKGMGLGILSPGIEEEPAPGSPASNSPRPGSIMKQSTVNMNLAPGTAAGLAAGPAEAAEPVDWDLWQAVVNEGPAAVARTSAEELNRAIASGIPQAIRGVIWQVMAQSKNEELESVYRELVARGTDKEMPPTRSPLLSGLNITLKEKDSVASSSSSIHSDYSTPATTTGSANAVGSPSLGVDNTEDVAKLQAKLAAEKKERAKQESAAIQKLEKTIKRDLGARTSFSKYLMSAGLQDGLFGICKAYALYDEPVGYAQGMNFIAMPLLFNMPEEEAFCLFVTLMNKYGLRDLFIQDMPGLHLHLYQFERLLEDLEPALYCHLRRRDVKPQLYATQWFLTLFAYRFPLQLVLRIYDLILSEGLEGAILKFGIVLMQKNRETLLGMRDMATLSTFLKERLFDVYIDKAPSSSSILESGFFGSAGGIDKEVYRADMLVQDALSVKIMPETLQQYASEWKEQQRIEKERETELQMLKDKAMLLEKRVRVLEHRAEQSDAEHVQVASDLIKTKVENETLADENEMLKTKAEELQKIVDTQAAEVEARLKSEMETVMQKNIVVHNENRALEENMAEMEKELVATKMRWATINEEHEQLKQKWHNITQMMTQ